MADLRPPVDAFFGPFEESAIVTIDGFAPAPTVWVEQRPAEGSADSGNWSISKSRRRGSLRLDQLPAPPRPDVSWPPPGTTITIGTETMHVEEVGYHDDEVAHVIVR